MLQPIFRLVIFIRTGILGAFLMQVAFPSFATCSGSGNGSAIINLPSQLPSNASVGTVLYDSGWVTAAPTVILYSCGGSQRGAAALTTSGTLVSGNAVYATGIPGIGIAAFFTADNSGGSTTGPYAAPATNGGTVTSPTYCTNACGPMGPFRVQLVVTGPISTGSMSYSGVYATSYWSGSQVGTLTINGTTNVVAPTCTVQTTSIAVSLPTVSANALPTVGSTAGNTPFNIVLNCSGPSRVGMVLTDANNNGNTTANLTLQSGGAAGTAVRVLWNGTPITLGQQTPFVSGGTGASTPVINPAMVALGTSPTGSWTLPFVAQYIRTGAVSPGGVVARAIFTMTYQ